MANEMITSLPGVSAATLSDITYAVQGYTSPSSLGTSVQETWAQVFALLQSGANISINQTGGRVVIASTGLAGIGWQNVTGLTQAMVADNGYVADSSAGVCVLTLPASAAFGTLIYVQGLGSSGWKVAQNAGQQIIIGDVASTSGATGYIASNNAYDSILLLCAVANTTFVTLGGPMGNITVN